MILKGSGSVVKLHRVRMAFRIELMEHLVVLNFEWP
jgi:hypothetical protein